VGRKAHGLLRVVITDDILGTASFYPDSKPNEIMKNQIEAITTVAVAIVVANSYQCCRLAVRRLRGRVSILSMRENAMSTTARSVFLCAAFFCAWISGAALAGANTILTFEPESVLLEGKTFETLINQDYGDNVVTTNDLTSPFRYGGAMNTPNIVVSYAPVDDPGAGMGVRFVGANSIYKDDGTFNYGPTGDLTNIIYNAYSSSPTWTVTFTSDNPLFDVKLNSFQVAGIFAPPSGSATLVSPLISVVGNTTVEYTNVNLPLNIADGHTTLSPGVTGHSITVTFNDPVSDPFYMAADSFDFDQIPAPILSAADVAGYFKFDTFPGDRANFTDDAGKGLRGLLGFPFSQPVSVPGPSGLPGDLAVSLDLNGGLAVDDSAAQILNILTPPLTLECWVRSTNASQIGVHRAFISYGVPGGPPVAGLVRGGYKLGIHPNGNILFTLFAVVDVDSGIPFPVDGAWHHVAAVYSVPDGGVTFYLDGQNVAFVAETRDLTPPGTHQLDIGAQDTGTGRFDGALDRVRISKAALTLAQLDSVVGTVKPVVADTAVLFNFDEASPPYQGQGLQPAAVAIPEAEWVINHPPRVSSGGPNASGSGPAKVTDTPSGATNDLAIQFDVNGTGAADMAAVPDPSGVLNLDGDWTLEAWVKYPVNVTGDRDVIFYYGHPGHGYSLSINYLAGNQLQVTTLGIADMPATAAVVDPDLWQHVAVVHKKGVSITYFTNGVEAESRTYTQGTILATTNKVLYIGAEWNGGLPFTGFIDRVRISNSALTASQLDSDPKNPAALPLPPPPALQLAISRSQSNVILSWPEVNAEGYILEFSNSLPSSSWSPETSPLVVVVGGKKTVTAPITGFARYYRLKKP
jgi:Concanavalin A-like lectin/glucanases superfamily